MRPRPQRNTNKGLGAIVDELAQEDVTPPPPSTRGVTAVPPSEVNPGRYSIRPATTDTREFQSPVSREKRRNTDKMPAHVDETPRANAVRGILRAGSSKPRRLASSDRLEQAPLGSREAFVLSLIDGKAPISSLVDVAGMDEAELVDILERLVVLKLIEL